MNKAELIDAVVTTTELAKTDATRAVEALFDAIVTALKRGESITVPGFGVFSVKDRAPRPGRNPRTGVTMQISAKKAVGFKAGKALKDALN